MTYKALPCNCSGSVCPHWHVSDVADVHGVSFTRAQAEKVAAALNGWLPMDTAPPNKRLILKCEENDGYVVREGLFHRASKFDSKPNWRPWCGSTRVTSTEILHPMGWMERFFNEE